MNDARTVNGQLSPGRSRILGLTQVLWPGSEVSSARSLVTGPSKDALRFAVIPSVSHPRLLLPLSPARATSNAIRNYKASATGKRLWKVEAVTLATRAGLAHLLAEKISINTTGEGIDAYLGRSLGQPIVVALYIGPSRAVQKPIMQILTYQGKTVAFAKVAINALTASLIRNEVVSLETLRQAQLASLSAPRVLDLGEWNGQPIIVQEAVAAGKSQRRIVQILPSATRELAALGGVEEVSWPASTYRRSVRSRISCLESSNLRGQLLTALDEFDTVMGERTLHFGSWHGDWARWNMTTSSDGRRVVAWDWEHFESGVPVGFDAVHYDVSESVVVEGKSPSAAFAQALRSPVESLLSATVSDTETIPVTYLYLLEIATRYLEHDEVSIGDSPMSRVGDWFSAASSNALRELERDHSNG